MKTPRVAIDGVLLIDKPLGMSAQQLVSHCKYLLRAEKAGHGGTLDPLATGLMVLAFGEATKFLAHQLEADKTYLATLRLGAATDSADLEGNIIARSNIRPNINEIEQVLSHFRGPISQTPPAHSAIKIDGKRAYELARAGEEVVMKSRAVTIHALKVISFQDDELTLRVTCSKGTYIRSLARDIGEALGSLAHLSGLVREAAGGFQLKQALNIESFRTNPSVDFLAPSDALLVHLSAIHLDENQSALLRLGQSLLLPEASAYAPETELRCYDHCQQLLGVVSAYQGKIHPVRLIKQIN